ncbi:MAG: sigma-E processing peptidase SpoIIGA [Acetatifactor sp.]|nr:sigma-E processing peptidase SpoIIGA [Acetatifactor sp.]MDE7353836.1 sigma-E processing peptidase SpoIIGA [Acetatifactor sp.]
MRYELYADSLFVINFVMNLYLLFLVDRSTFRTATPGRLLLGAAFGGFSSLLPFVLSAPGLLKQVLGMAAGAAGMIVITFSVKRFRTFLKLLEKLLVYSFCMGGALLFLVQTFPGIRAALTGVCGILGAGGILCLFLGRICKGKGQEDSICRAVLIHGTRKAAVNALIDSGNSLTEPLSGSPVSVVDEDIFRKLWGDSVQGCRVIPYHSIGKRRGILMGYLLPELRLEVGGLERTFRRVYIAVSKEEIASDSAGAEAVKMIINPRLLEEAGKGKQPKRQNERTYDSESSDTGKNAV